MNHQLESRMRENRTYGSEGGGAGTTGSSYPYVRLRACMDSEVKVLARHALSGL